ncbi:zinc finger and SCAN domain-containing protein 21-like [Schistocerca cancellata]|uniref:zinc finger and SCAN domain-containing protein 21-like n=1 Tax=Schistocerca cancellata TaxID=274614 RepID=UPI002118ABEF|nr:zinc finger and SCAN domain-containing protein 21-like [Schistocerca cancellata]
MYNCGTGAERQRKEPMQQTTRKMACSANSGPMLVACVVYCDSTIRNMMNPEKRYTCSECGKSYSYNKTLRKHVSQVHPGKLNDIALQLKVQKFYKYLCSLCGKQFNHERNVMCDERKEHGLETSFMKVKCTLCDISVLSKKNCCDHLSMRHGE